MELRAIIADYVKQASQSDFPKFDFVGFQKDSGQGFCTIDVWV